MSGQRREGNLIGARYRLNRPLGEGGFAVVWAATHTGTGSRVALKFLKETYAADVRVRQRFLREARAASAVRHPNVIAIQDVFEDDGGVPVIAMDLLDGESLGQRLRREGALSVAEVAAIMRPVVSAVACAHDRGIVHRDLKPDNIFLARSASVDGPVEIKVLDFGVAKLTAREGDAARSGSATNTGALLGTPYYMSPEQIFGDGEVDARSDVWALGVVLYECLAGVRPTQAESVGLVIRMIASDSIVPLAQRAPALPQDLTAMVMKALSFDNAERPSLEDFSAVLAAHVDSELKLVVTTSMPTTTSAQDTALEPAATIRRAMPAAVLGLAVVATGVMILAWRGSTQPPAPVASSPTIVTAERSEPTAAPSAEVTPRLAVTTTTTATATAAAKAPPAKSASAPRAERPSPSAPAPPPAPTATVDPASYQ